MKKESNKTRGSGKAIYIIGAFIAALIFILGIASALVINEFMANPSSGDDWIEFYNNDSVAVNLTGWIINDSTGTLPYYLSGIINPDEFVVINVSNRLNQDGDSILLIDNNSVIDNYNYNFRPADDKTIGRYSDGSDNWYNLSLPTYGTNNFYDVNAPSYSNISENPVSGSANYSASNIYQFNIVWGDNTNMSNVWIEFDNTNYSIAGNVNYNFTIINLRGGVHYYRWHANDTAGNVNATDLLNYTIDKADGSVSLLLNNSAGNIDLVYGNLVNASASTPYGIVTLYRNSANATSQNNAFVLLGVNYHNYTAFSSGDENYTGTSITRFVNITKTTPALNLAISNNLVIYPNKVLVNGSGCPSQLSCILYKNNISIANPINATFGGGNHSFIYNTTGNENYTLATSGISKLEVLRGIPTLSYYINGQTNNITLVYPQQVNASAYTTGGIANIYRNGVNATSEKGKNVTLGANYYSYQFNVAGNENWSDLQGGLLYVNVTRTLSRCLISASASSVTYPNSITVIASCTNPESPLQLYRNGINVTNTNGQAVVLGANNYTFIVNVTESQNYTYAGNSTNITVNKGAGSVYTFLNGTRSNRTIYKDDSLWLNGTLASGAGTIALYNNGNLINSGANNVGNLTIFHTTGVYNITTIYAGNENYTGTSETWFANVLADTTVPIVTIIHPQNNAYYNTTTLNLNYSVVESHIDKCWYSLNNGITNSSPTTCGGNFILGANEGSNTWRVYANDTSNNVGSASVTFNIDSIIPNVTLNSPIANMEYNTSNVLVNMTMSEDGSCYYVLDDEAGYGLTTSDNETFSLTRVIANGNHTIYGVCSDKAGNSKSSASVNFRVMGNAPSSSYYYIAMGGGGRGTSSSERGANYEISEEQVTRGYSATMKKDEKLKFIFNGEIHYLNVDGLTDSSATITITSSPVTLIINLGESKDADVNGDGVSDIIVRLDGINDKRAEIYVEKSFENAVIKASDEESSAGATRLNVVGDGYEEESKIYYYITIGLIITICIVLLLIIICAARKTHRKK